MPALGELIVMFILVAQALASVVLLVLTFTARRSRKPWNLLGSIFFVFLFFSSRAHLKKIHEEAQSDRVGIYYLTNYHGCDSCLLELKEDLTYEVRNGAKVIEASNWHFESGGDYWITWLDNDRHQLGTGDYSYKEYKLRRFAGSD